MRYARRKGKACRNVLVCFLYRSWILLLKPFRQHRDRLIFIIQQLVRRFSVGLLKSLHDFPILLEEGTAHDNSVHRKDGRFHVAHMAKHVHAHAHRFS